MFVVNYESEFGHTETFGPFDTVQEAQTWAKADAEYNIKEAEKNGVGFFKLQTLLNGLMYVIEDYGTWQVALVKTPGHV